MQRHIVPYAPFLPLLLVSLSYANTPDYDDNLALNGRAVLQWRRGGKHSTDAMEALALLLNLMTGTDGIVNRERLV
jgi:hypothetical protein